MVNSDLEPEFSSLPSSSGLELNLICDKQELKPQNSILDPKFVAVFGHPLLGFGEP